MNILLVRPKPHKNTVNLQSFMICEPLELEYCASFLESFGHSVTIADLILEKAGLVSFLKKGKYGLVGFTGYICHVGIIKNYAGQVKKYDKNIITAVGGVHAEVVPEDFIDQNIDCVLGRGGLNGIADIAKGKEYRPADTINTEFNFPFPDREKTRKYRDKYNYVFHQRCATIKTSFGCPYNCGFCFCARVSPYFTRPLSEVIEEIKIIKEDNIFIVDDNFLFDTQRVRDFCRLLNDNDIRKSFIAFGRADFIAQNEDIMRLLRAHGFEAIFVGLESFKIGELDDLNKRTTAEENIKAVRVLEACGLRCYAGIIVRHDWERADFDALIDYINSFNNIFVNIQPLTPMPGTPLYAELKGLISVPRSRYELWDMAHLLIKPSKMSKRRFYYHILRAYLKTVASKKTRTYILREFGGKVYRRVRHGAAKIFVQYLKLMIKGRQSH